MESVLFIIGNIFVGGHIFSLAFISAYFLLIAPRIHPKQNPASRAVSQMLGIIMLYQLMTYLLWLIPELSAPEAQLYGVISGWEDFEEALDYLDVLALPIYLLLGHVVTRGEMPPFKLYLPYIIIYVVCVIVSILLDNPDWFFNLVSSLTLLYCLLQFFWYAYCVKTYNKKLLDHCSNIDNRTMSWYLHSQLPALVVVALYVPMVAIHDELIYSVVYDILLMAAHVYMVVAVMLHRVDDNMYEVIQNIDYRAEIHAEAEARAKAQETPAAAPAAPFASELPADPQKETSFVPQSDSNVDALSAPSEWTREERENFDFSMQMKKLEDDEFYTDPDVNIDWLADHLGTNRHYVSNYLNQIKKQNFYEYVNSLRLSHAELLLRTSNEKASSIGYMSGFNSEATYRRLFKDRFGCTPTQYVRRVA